MSLTEILRGKGKPDHQDQADMAEGDISATRAYLGGMQALLVLQLRPL